MNQKLFFHREKGNSGEVRYYLDRNAETGAVYVERHWTASGYSGSNRIEISDFLAGPYVPASNSFLRLIGGIIERQRKRNLN